MSTPAQRQRAVPSLAPDRPHHLATALLAWMEREGLTQAQAATRLDMSNIRLGGWLNGTWRPSPEEVERVLTCV